MPFEDYYQEVVNAPDREYINVGDLNIERNVLVDSDMLVYELQRLDKKNDQEIYNLVMMSYNLILDIDFINKGKNRIFLANAFKDRRFVSVFCNIVSSVQITDIQKICCNKFIYDYFTMASSSKDEYIVNLLYNLGWMINQQSVPGLYGKGLDQKLVTYLAIARYSTTDERLAAKRVNVIIINQPLSVMTEQIIINIYEELFNKSLLALFEGIMFDYWDFDNDEIEYDEEQEEVYGTINLAILDIVNDMPMTMITELLRSYSQTKQYCHSTDRVRFDIHSISADYSRILQAIRYVESEGIFVPHY